MVYLFALRLKETLERGYIYLKNLKYNFNNLKGIYYFF